MEATVQLTKIYHNMLKADSCNALGVRRGGWLSKSEIKLSKNFKFKISCVKIEMYFMLCL